MVKEKKENEGKTKHEKKMSFCLYFPCNIINISRCNLTK